MSKATCMITKNDSGYHKVVFDKYVPALLWKSAGPAQGQLVSETKVRRPRSERGGLHYTFLGEDWELDKKNPRIEIEVTQDG